MTKKISYQKNYRLFRHTQNLLRVQATLGGIEKGDFVRLRLLVDTGASFTVLPVQVLEDLGYDINNPLRREEVFTGQGKISIPVVNLSWFNCAEQFRENFEVVGHNLPAASRVDGLLGMDFMRHFQAIINVENALMSFPKNKS